MICAGCGTVNSEGTVSCSACGSAFSGTFANGVSREAAIPSASQVATGTWGAAAAARAAIPDFGPRYRVEQKLGEGGMRAVYKARDLELNRTVALKLIRAGLASDPEASQRFKQELLLASKVTHKNVLRIHDLGEAGGTKFISMAYVQGADLHQVLNGEGKLSIDRALHIARQLCARWMQRMPKTSFTAT